MKTSRPRYRALALAALLAGPLRALAQQTTAPSGSTPTAARDDEVLKLSVFEIVSSKDSAYVADKSVATTGFAADLAKIPLAIGVVTSQFLEDTGGFGFNGVANYQAGFTTDQGGMDNGTRTVGIDPTVGAVTGGEPLRTRIRGQPINIVASGTAADEVRFRHGERRTRGGRPWPDVRVHRRLDSRWRHEPGYPQAAAFNGGLPVRRPSSSNDSYQFRVDLTGPILKDKLAYRLIAPYQ